MSDLTDSDIVSKAYRGPRGGGQRRKMKSSEVKVAIATLRNAVELLEGDGSVPTGWPVEQEGLTFLGSPVIHDVDGDGVPDICLVSTDANNIWLSSGDHGRHLDQYDFRILARRVEDRFAETFSFEVDSELSSPHEEVGMSPVEHREAPSEERADSALASRTRRLSYEEVGGEDHEDVRDRVLDLPDLMAAYTEDGGYAYAGEGVFMDADGARLEIRPTLEGYRPLPERVYGTTPDADAHLLASPVFADVNNDGTKEMFLAISFYHTSKSTILYTRKKYVAASLGCWDVIRRNWVWLQDIGQTFDAPTGELAYAYATPTIADIDADGSLEVIIGTAEGHLHIFDALNGQEKDGFPVFYGPIKSQVAVADVDNDGRLEMLFGDTSGKLVCLNHRLVELWTQELEGAITNTVTLGDVDGDNTLDVVVGTTSSDGEGAVWVFGAADGTKLPSFPVKLQNRKGISAPVLLVDLHENSAGSMGKMAPGFAPARPIPKRGGNPPLGGSGPGLHLLASSEDGHVYVIEGQTGCVNKIDFGERISTMVLADDLEGDGMMDLIVGTMSGEVVAMSANVPFHPLNAWSSSVRGQLNGFVHGNYQGVFFVAPPHGYDHVKAREFNVQFEIVDKRPARKERDYKVSMYIGNRLLFSGKHAEAGVHDAVVVLKAPGRYLLRIEVINEHYQLFEDYVSVGYNEDFHAMLKWIVVAPLSLVTASLWWGLRHGLGPPTPLPA